MAREIATGIGLTLLIFFVALQVPLFGFFGALLMPLPTLFYRVKFGRRQGGMVPACGAAVMALAGGPPTVDLFFFAALLLLGFVLGELLERPLPVEVTVVAACAAVAAAAGTALLLAAAAADRGVGTLVGEYVARNLQMTLEVYRSMGVPEENVRIIADAMDRIEYVLVRILPALALTTLLVVTWANLLLARGLLRRRGLPFPDFGRLDRWRAPEGLVWAVIAAGVALLVPAQPLKLAGINALMVLMAVYFLQGIAIVAFFFEKKGFPRPLRVFLYSLIAVQQVLLLIVVGLGFFDMWFNFRRQSSPDDPR